MKYRILKSINKRGDISYIPQIKRSFFGKWKNIIYDKDLNYYWDTTGVTMELEEFDSAKFAATEHKKSEIYKNQSKSKIISKITI